MIYEMPVTSSIPAGHRQKTTPFYTIFGFQQKTEIKCLKCGNIQGPCDTTMGLTMSVDEANSVAEGLRVYSNVENLDEKIECEG